MVEEPFGQRTSTNNQAQRYEHLVVAPFLWEREQRRKGKDDQITKLASVERKLFRLNTDNMEQLSELLNNTAIMLKQLTNSDGVLVYMVDNNSNEIVHDAGATRTASRKMSWPIGMGRTIAAHVAHAKEYVLVNGVSGDGRFVDGTGWGDSLTTSVICVPVLTLNENCFAVIELTRQHDADYTQRDLDTVTVVSGWMGSTIEQHQKRLIITRREHIKHELSCIMQSFISMQVEFDTALCSFLNVAKEAIGAEYGVLYRFDGTKTCSSVGLMDTYDPPLFRSDNFVVLKKLKSNILGLVRMCADTQQIINIEDTTTDSRFDRKVDSKPSIDIRAVLYVPISDGSGHLGVLQMINKTQTGSTFSAQDENTLQIFSPFLGNMLKFKLICDQNLQLMSFNEIGHDIMLNRVRLHLVRVPITVPASGASIEEPLNFQNFDWYPYSKYMKKLIDLSYKMLTDICGDHAFDPNSTYIFLLMVKRLHRKIPYNNFEHSFAALHGVYCILKRVNPDRFDLIEKMSMMIAALCRDLDHDGTSNTYLFMSKNPLSKVYSHSFREHHAAWLGKFVIQNTGLLKLLSSEQRQQFYVQFHEHILFTDINEFLVLRINLDELGHCAVDAPTANSTVNWSNPEHRQKIRGLILVGSNMASLYKPFRATERLCANLVEELYAQGALVRRGGLLPVPFVDATKAIILPEIQLKILQIVGLPCFHLIRTFLPEAEDMYTNCRKLRKAWLEIIESRGKQTWFPDKSIPG